MKYIVLLFTLQMGRVVDNPVDFYHSRIPKKERKKTLVDELLADQEFRQYVPICQKSLFI